MKQTETRKKRLSGKWKLALLLLALLFAVAVSLSLAAIIGRGTRKGVLTGTVGYFSSDLLSKWNDDENVTSVEIQGHADFTIRNYNISTGDMNNFNITYDLYAWVEDRNLDQSFTYQLTFDNTVYPISQSAYDDTALIRHGTLLANTQQTDTYTVTFASSTADARSNARIVVAAIPTSPEFMSSKRRIGGFTHMPDAFAVSGGFDYRRNENTGTPLSPVDGYAAFIYRLSSSGTSKAEDKVRVQWDMTSLTLDANSDYNNATYLRTNVGQNNDETCLELSASDVDAGITLTFYRKTPVDDVDYWKDELWYSTDDMAAGWTALNNLVDVSPVISTSGS